MGRYEIGRSSTENIGTPRFGVGEIADLVGVGDYYDEETSQWLRTNTWVSKTILPDAVKAALREKGSDYRAISSFADLLASIAYIHPSRFSDDLVVNNKALIPAVDSSPSIIKTLVCDTAGPRIVATGMNATVADTIGEYSALVGNGAKVFNYAWTAAATLACRTSIDGETFTTEALSGLPIYSSNPSWNPLTAYGDQQRGQYVYGDGACLAVWCGARMLVLGKTAGGTASASLSANGLAFNGEQNTAVLGSAAITNGSSDAIFFHRNELKCYLYLQNGGAHRYSVDGGVTWSAATNPEYLYMRYVGVNKSNKDKLIAGAVETTSVVQTSNCGQAWVSRTLPAAPSNSASWAYEGSTILYMPSSSAGILYKSTDDGATWASITMPTGVTGLPLAVYHDGFKWIVVLTNGQLMTSTDTATWIVRSLPVSYASGINIGGCISLDALTTIISGNQADGKSIFTLDGGVSWKYALNDKSGNKPMSGYPVAVSVPGFNGVVSGPQSRFIATKDDLANDGAFFRSTTATVSPLRTNAIAYSRVG